MRITINLLREEIEQLRDMAYAERRSPREQAAVLISQKLAERTTEKQNAGLVPAQ